MLGCKKSDLLPWANLGSSTLSSNLFFTPELVMSAHPQTELNTFHRSKYHWLERDDFVKNCTDLVDIELV